ncbi:MAG: hypothetical protein EOQ86_19720 [Mesorhizobium sp.]|uniref:type II toxin-antitoxin system VapC family toxin n=1 Tax=Mesorhizobium sp. TaxID=1871066 RepID=UPI000FE4DBF8|nr:hypothetical protein [Mesorhizobium sp.]RWH76859.1 MAG: hypothetical protein EOQ85_20190 [Mesorhizobium sp.]RWH80168.1 MAG: hypothetical protein EOQ86_19720 [Mesorhizobium sp.]RWH88753.1 MAG: hypothetical protein EOQ87_20360 [Mesorhizobium sp.]RWH95610.1 MAG: hypothetical protein EOQ88_22490 [Mesorhizobium sp.]RWI01295.1 MAG: hypothetical protein EOQ89_16700 [Mesorhizobium sp.]
MKVMLDTNVFNHLLEGSIDLASIPGDWEPVITHLQNDEIERTSDPTKRKALQAMVIATVTVKVATESAVWGTSRWGEAKWSGPASQYNTLKTQLDAEKRRPSNTNDALIADTCIQNGFLLVTNDQALTKVATANGCSVRDLRTKR